MSNALAVQEYSLVALKCTFLMTTELGWNLKKAIFFGCKISEIIPGSKTSTQTRHALWESGDNATFSKVRSQKYVPEPSS
jgi:hypothetical protein